MQRSCEVSIGVSTAEGRPLYHALKDEIHPVLAGPLHAAQPGPDVIFFTDTFLASSLVGVGSDEINGAMPTELDPLTKRQCRPTGGVATASSFTVLVFL